VNIQRTLALVGKELKRLTREPANLFMAIIFPLVLTAAFGFSFGAIGGSESKYNIAFVDHDNTQWASMLHSSLTQVPVLNLQDYSDPVKATDDLSQGLLSAVITIPEGFGLSIDSYKLNPNNPKQWLNSTIGLSVDKGSMVASAAIPPLIQQILSTVVTGKQSEATSPVKLADPTFVTAEKISQFSYMAPGMFAYAAIFLLMLVAQVMVGEREDGLLRRISVTPTTVGDIFASQIVSNLIIGAVQTLIIYLASTLLGFHPLGGASGIAVAFIAVMLMSLCSVGLGLIVASIAKNAGTATGISFVLILPLMLLGSFVPAPEYIARLVPSWYLTHALTSIFIRGASISSPAVISDIGTLAAVSILLVVLGVLIYRRFGNR